MNIRLVLLDLSKNIDKIEVSSNKSIKRRSKKYNERTLFRMKQFYNLFKNEKVSTLSTQLTWSHYTELLSIKDENKLIYYLNVSVSENLSVRELREKIKNKEYDRLDENTKLKLINKEENKVIDYVKIYIN